MGVKCLREVAAERSLDRLSSEILKTERCRRNGTVLEVATFKNKDNVNGLYSYPRSKTDGPYSDAMRMSGLVRVHSC